MTLFSIKLIALICMFFDHLAMFLSLHISVNFNLYYAIRAIGRIAFPIFAFTIANGFHKSSNIRLYMKKLVTFAIVSYIPFDLLFSYRVSSGTSFSLAYPWYICVLICGLVAATWYFSVLRDSSALLAALAVLMPMLRFSLGSVWLITEDSSVFSTFALALPGLVVITKCIDSPRKHPELLIQIPVLLLCCYIVLPNSDYNFWGFALVIFLGLTINDLRKQVVLTLLWCLLLYYATQFNVLYFIISSFSCILLMMYNGKRGNGSSKLFYYFYPAHLLLLALFGFVI